MCNVLLHVRSDLVEQNTRNPPLKKTKEIHENQGMKTLYPPTHELIIIDRN